MIEFDLKTPPNLDLRVNNNNVKAQERFFVNLPPQKFMLNPKYLPLDKNDIENFDEHKMKVIQLENLFDNNKNKDIDELREYVEEYRVQYHERQNELNALKSQYKELKDMTRIEMEKEKELKSKMQEYKSSIIKKNDNLSIINKRKHELMEENRRLMEELNNKENNSKMDNSSVVNNNYYNPPKDNNIVSSGYHRDYSNVNNEGYGSKSKASYYIIDGKKYPALPNEYKYLESNNANNNNYYYNYN